MTTKELIKKEIDWYKKYGKYPERIIQNINGLVYMIGDWSWNRNHPNKKEYIEHLCP